MTVSALNWLSNLPHKAWVDPGEGSFACQVWLATVNGVRTATACVAVADDINYSTAPLWLWGKLGISSLRSMLQKLTNLIYSNKMREKRK